MLQRHIRSRNYLQELVEIPELTNPTLTEKQRKRAVEIQKKIKSLKQKMAAILRGSGGKG